VHVVGDLPSGELAGAKVDAGGEVEVGAVRDGQIGSDVADVAAARFADTEVQVG